MLAVRHGVHARPIARQMRDEIERVLPGNVGVLQAVENMDRPARVERRIADQVVAAIRQNAPVIKQLLRPA